MKPRHKRPISQTDMRDYEITIGEFKYLIIGAINITAATKVARSNGVTLDDTYTVQEKPTGNALTQYYGVFYA